MKGPAQFVVLGTIGLIITACGSTKVPSGADASGSTSEAAIASAGGAASSTQGDSIARLEQAKKATLLAQLMREFSPLSSAMATAAGECPTIKHAFAGSCSNSGQSLTLTFPPSGCINGVAATGAIWFGGTTITTTGAAPVCGNNYPLIDGSSVTSISRTYLGDLIANPTVRTNAPGTETVVIDTSAPSSATFAAANASSPVSGTIGWQYSLSGGGYTRSFVSSGNHSLAVNLRTVAYSGSATSGTVQFDHTISTTNAAGVSTPLQIQVSGSGTGLSQTINGTLNLQHNLMKMTAAAQFNDVEQVYGCCYPVSGKVVTQFSGGLNDGLQETTSFSQATCTEGTMGQVQFTDISGNTTTKTLTHCF